MGGACCSSSASAGAVYGEAATFGDEPKYSFPHVTFGICSKGGKGEFQNQDSPMAVKELGGVPNVHVFAVFDGHGAGGKEVSNFLRGQFPQFLKGDSAWPRKPEIALKNTSMSVNSKLKAYTAIDSTHSGSTGCICAIVGDTIISANTGDSRAIVGMRSGSRSTRPLQLTEDQTAKNPKERARIQGFGGRIIGERIYCANSDEPGLIPSRAYGDFNGAPAGITCEPDIKSHEIGDKTAWLAIMSDGVWENVPAAQISNMIMSSGSLSSAAANIVSEAKRIIHTGGRYRDDMTCVVVQFHNYGPSGVLRSRKNSGTGAEVEGDITEDEMLLQAVEVCREAMEQGVHADDVLDMLVGLSDETRERVRAILEMGPPTATAPTATAPTATSSPSNNSPANGQKPAGPQRSTNKNKSRRASDVESKRGSKLDAKRQFRRRSMMSESP